MDSLFGADRVKRKLAEQGDELDKGVDQGDVWEQGEVRVSVGEQERGEADSYWEGRGDAPHASG